MPRLLSNPVRTTAGGIVRYAAAHAERTTRAVTRVSAVVSSDPASKPPMKRRATEREVADDAGKLILASGTSGFGTASGAGTAGSVNSCTIWLRWHIWKCWGWLWQWLLQRLGQQPWPERQQHGCCQIRVRKPSSDPRNRCRCPSCQARGSWTKVLEELSDFASEKVPVGDVVVHGSGECDQLGLGDDMRERKKRALLKSLIGKSICEIAVGAMHTFRLPKGSCTAGAATMTGPGQSSFRWFGWWPVGCGTTSS